MTDEQKTEAKSVSAENTAQNASGEQKTETNQTSGGESSPSTQAEGASPEKKAESK